MEQEFLQEVKEAIVRAHMIEPGELVLVGVSGGADSVALLLALHALQGVLGYTLRAVHVEHGLRGDESLRDMRFTQALCEQHQIPCTAIQVDVLHRARQEHLSTEEAARALRYEAFARVKAQYGAQKIATAHHSMDQAETVLLNLCRGSGMTGLGGIRPVNGDRIRPLLGISRAQIEAFLQSKDQPYVVDETNAEDDYTRNRIRHHILPALNSEINVQATQHIVRLAEDVRAAEGYLEREARAKMGDIRPENGEVHIPDAVILSADPVIAERIVRLAIRDLRHAGGLQDIGRKHIMLLMQLFTMQTGKVLELPDGLRAVKQSGKVVLYVEKVGESAAGSGKVSASIPLSAPGGETQLEGGTLRWRYISPEEVPDPIPESHCTKWLSYDTMSGEICLRTRQTGDYLIVGAGGGRKKLKDYLIDQKIPRRMRDAVPLVAQGAHILWVIGGRISESAKLGGSETSVLWVEYEEKQEENHG